MPWSEPCTALGIEALSHPQITQLPDRLWKEHGLPGPDCLQGPRLASAKACHALFQHLQAALSLEGYRVSCPDARQMIYLAVSLALLVSKGAVKSCCQEQVPGLHPWQVATVYLQHVASPRRQ